MNLLLHTCCSACLIYPYESLQKENVTSTILFYNPNIHPYREFRKRLVSLKEYLALIKAPNIIDENYNLDWFLQKVVGSGDKRCKICYTLRLQETARIAKEKGYDAFSSTLLVSIHQDHNAIKEIGEKIAKDTGLIFYYKDWRDGFEYAHQKAKEFNFYMQSYCGCIYSEEERYRPSKRRKIIKKFKKENR